MKKTLTEEQKQRRAETARRNGAKSKGPVTIEGKQRSSMNAISVGAYVDVHAEELPPNARILSVEDRKAYVRLHQANLRQYNPQSESELSLVRNITAEQFEYERYRQIETLQFQSEHEEAQRESPDAPAEHRSAYAIEFSVKNNKVHRLIERKMKTHLLAWTRFVALYTRIRKSFPVEPVAPPENEPKISLPAVIPYLVHNESFIREFAPHCNVAELRRRYPIPNPKIAA
jgi:hypothetical protein